MNELLDRTEAWGRMITHLAAKDQRIANLESELKIARDQIEILRRQLSAANLGSSMQHERFGSY